MIVRLGQIVEALGGELIGGGQEIEVARISPLETADAGSISFLSNPRYEAQMAASKAACVVVAHGMRDAAVKRGACIVVANPYVYFAKLTQFWRSIQKTRVTAGIHPSAVVDLTASIAATAYIGPQCVIGAGVKVGAFSTLTSRITVADGCEIGERCLLHPGVVIGADGFGFANDAGVWVKIEQLGGVRIGNDVEIGANTCIDRGALDDTIIEDGVKIDNLVQIAHNVHVGAHSVIAGNAGVAGSARIGKHCSIGGAANILGHLSIADGTSISPTSMVTRSIHQADLYTGIFPLQTNAQWEKNAASLKHLHALRERIKKLESVLKTQNSNNGNS